MTEFGSAAVRAAVQAAPHAFSTEDFEPRPIGASQKRRLKKRSSVFVSGGDWASPSSRAILDALHDLSASEASNSDEAKAQLPFMRNAGSMMVDGEDADLFDAETVRATGPHKKNNSHLVECVHCHRPVLTTRFLAHLRVCAKFTSRPSSRKDSAKVEEDVSGLEKVDSELNLVSAPYKSKSLCDNGLLGHSLADEAVTGEPLIVEVALPYFSGSPADICALQKRGCQWQKRLTPLLPVRSARGSRTRRLPKVPLVPLTDPPPPKKKQNTAERRALAAAASVDLGRITPSSQTPRRDENDPFKFAGGDWGIGVPWTKLMKLVRPVRLPRSYARKQYAPRETPLSLFTKDPGNPGQILQAETEAAKMVPLRPTSRIAKAVSKPKPSLPGALLYVRGKYNKNLQHTSLGAMDIGNSSMPKSFHMYHGQSYFPPSGTYISDVKANHEVTLPTAVIDTAAAIRNMHQRAAAAGVAQGQAIAGARAAGGGSDASPQHPPLKRQRSGKQQPRAVPVNHAMPNAAGVPPKQPQNAQRKMPPQRQMSNAALANQKLTNAKLQQLAQQRGALPGGPNAVNNAAVAAANAINLKRAQAQPAQVKRPYRNQVASAIPPSAINATALNAAQTNAGKIAASAAASAIMKGPNRGARGRQQHAVPVNGNPQAHKMIHHPVLNAFQQQNPGLANRGGPNVGGRPNAANFDPYLRGATSAAMPHAAGLNYHQELAQVVARAANTAQESARPASRNAVAGRAQHRPDLSSMHDLERVQLLAQLSGQTQQGQMRNIPRQSAALLRRYNQPQARQGEAQRQSPSTSAALNARQNGQMNNPVQMFAGQQIAANLAGLYNAGFPSPHDRVSSQAMAQSMPMSGQNAANLAFLQMLQSTPGAALPNQMPGAAAGIPGAGAARAGMQNLQDMRAMQGFVPGLGAQNNMINYFPTPGDPGNQNLAAIATARMANSNPLVAGILPTDPMMSQLMPNARAAPHPNMMHMPQANAAVSLGATAGHLLPTGTNAAATTTSQALSDIDKALSLDPK